MKRLLLIGAGHAHLGVLAELAQAPLAGVEVTLVTPYPRQIYSGMLPGWIAGHYTVEQCAIAVAPVAARAQAHLVFGQVVQLDLVARSARTAQGETLAFDWVSIDTGAVPQPELTHGASFEGAALRPIEAFITVWQRWCTQPAPRVMTVIGGGAAGVEIALAMAWHLRPQRARVSLQLVAGRRGVLPELPQGVRRRVLAHLTLAHIKVIDADAVALDATSIQLAHGDTVHSDWTLVATGSAAAAWPCEAGLAVDERGFIQTLNTLQSSSHPFVFAAGDCASLSEHPRARSGVYAVRAGPPLAQNLRRAATGAPLLDYVPQKRALYLLSTGGRHAIASWGAWSFEGNWVWRWKDWIDRRFVARYAGESNK